MDDVVSSRGVWDGASSDVVVDEDAEWLHQSCCCEKEGSKEGGAANVRRGASNVQLQHVLAPLSTTTTYIARRRDRERELSLILALCSRNVLYKICTYYNILLLCTGKRQCEKIKSYIDFNVYYNVYYYESTKKHDCIEIF